MYQEIKDYIIAILRSRLLPLVAVFIVMLVVLINRLFQLQIVLGDEYLDSIAESIESTRDIASTRGNIYDCNGVLLAYNDLAFSVKISDSGRYDSISEKNRILNEVIAKAVTIMENHNERISCDFSIVLNEDGKFEFNVSSENAKLRFLRDSYGVKTIADLSDAQRNSTAEAVINFLCNDAINGYGVDSSYSDQMKIYILNFRTYMSANSYQRYMEFTMAYDVNDETVAEILENSGDLMGVTVSEEYIRKYVDGFYAAHILGYTGKISSDELATLQQTNSQYAANDVIGKAGIEQAMEEYLQGSKGERRVYMDSVGRITEVIEQTEPVTGCDVYLTIDIELQKKVYNAIEQKIADILVGKITDSDTRYVYASDETTINDILIPINDVYFALIDNNVLSLSEIAQKKTSTESSVYNKFLSKQQQVLTQVEAELTDDDTAYSALTGEMQVYIYNIYEILRDEGIIVRGNIDTTDSMYNEWVAETVSLKEFLSYGLAMGWIDVSQFTDTEYSSLSEAYTNLVSYTLRELRTNTEFSKKIYRYMIQYRQLTGSEICIMLYDQGILPYDSEAYGRLIMGSLSPYSFMLEKIGNCEITPAQLALRPCSGSSVIIDNNTGRILAMVSYPSYDINNLSGTVDATYYSQLLNDASHPLVNNATMTQTAPGSTYKMVSAIAGLENNVITSSEIIECNGIYETVTPNPKCHIYPSRHGDESVATAIRDSCNIYFYEVGYRLAMTTSGKYDSSKGTNILADYAKLLGLATTSGIEIYESTPMASTDNAVASAIGQGNNSFTSLNLARYCSTIANSGTCYDLTLIDKIVDNNGNNLFVSIPIVSSTMNDVSSSTWNLVHSGMRMVSENSSYLATLGIKTGAKSGTAQENARYPDHTTFVCYAPYDNPEIAMSVVIQNGYASANAGTLTADILKIYYGIEDEAAQTTTNDTTANATATQPVTATTTATAN